MKSSISYLIISKQIGDLIIVR